MNFKSQAITMNSPTPLTLLALATLFVAGCATAPQANPSDVVEKTSATFTATKDEVWPAVIAAVGFHYPLTTLDKESGLLATDWLNVPVGYGARDMGRYVFKPRVFLGVYSTLRVNLRIMVVELNPEKTQVRINSSYQVLETNVIKGWITAATNGHLESGLLDDIGREVRQAKHRAQNNAATATSD